MTTILIAVCILAAAAYFYVRYRSRKYCMNLKRVGLAAAHVRILTGSEEALTAVAAVKANLYGPDGKQLIELVKRLPDITTPEMLKRQAEVVNALEAQPLSLKDQVQLKQLLRSQSKQWSQAVQSANFDIASKILLQALNAASPIAQPNTSINNSRQLRIENLKILRHISFDPLVAFEDPKDFWIDGMLFRPIDDLELSVPLYKKLTGSNIWHLNDLAPLCLNNIRKRCGLSDRESAELSIALQCRGIILPDRGEMTVDELHAHLRDIYADEIQFLVARANDGSQDAALFVAKLASEGILEEDDQPLYRKAIALGSGQAANDLAALLMRSKSYDPKLWKEVANLLELASRRGCKTSEKNLACMHQIMAS